MNLGLKMQINCKDEVEIRKKTEEYQNLIIEQFALIYSKTIEKLSSKFGKEIPELSKKIFIDTMKKFGMDSFKNVDDRSLKSYIDWLLSALEIGHEYKIIENNEKSVKLIFNKCPWAFYFNKYNSPEIGKYFCLADGPLAKAFNKKISFKITKTIMDGNSYCNHHYFIK
jgi:hypothetical protein